MKKKEVCFLIAFILLIFLNIFWLSTYNKPEKSTFIAFVSLKNFIFSSMASIGRIFITIIFEVRIYSPQNTTYNFSIGVPYTLNLNVSSNRVNVINSWWYDLIDLKHNTVVNQSVFFNQNTTFNAVRWSNKIIVYANDTVGTVANSSVTFYVNVPNSAPIIGYISPEIYVCEGDYLSYYFNATDVDEDVLTSDIFPKNPFYVYPVISRGSTLTIFEIFSGTLNKNNIGGVNKGWKIYEETVSIADGEYADSVQTNITIIEINNAPSIENIGVQTIWSQGENTSFYYKTQVTDIENGNQDSGNLTFNITILNSTGNVVNLFDISSNGIMNFMANESHLGAYNVSISVTDKALINPHPNISSKCGEGAGNSKTSVESFSLVVTNVNRPPIIISYYPLNLTLNVDEGKSVYFNISAYDSDGEVLDAYWYDNISLLEYDEGSLFFEFTYYPDYNDAGNHTIIGKVTDGILNSSYDYVLWNVTVNDSTPPAVPVVEGGGGGGVGISKAVCIEKWGCGYWSVCQNTEKSLEVGILSGGDYRVIKENCTLKGWDKEHCGFQTMNCFDLNYCNTTIKKPSEIQECYYTTEPSCYDGIKNCHDGACELLVDCGGPCPQCPTCSDKIKNQGEEGIDCGGPCPPCAKEKPIAKKPLRYFLISLSVLLLLIAVIILIKNLKLKKKLGEG